MAKEPSVENPRESQPEHRTQNKGNRRSRNRDEQMTDPPYEERSTQYQGDSQEEGGPPHRERGT